MTSRFTIFREAVLGTVHEMAAATKAAGVLFFDTVIAREATEDDLPEPIYLVAQRDDFRRTSR